MLIEIAYPVECPQKIIPSFVWLERFKERPNLIREMLKNSPTLELRFAVSDREFSLPTFNASRGPENSEDSLVKSIPKISNSVSSYIEQSIRDRFGEHGFVEFMDSIRIRLDNNGCWLSFVKGKNLLVKIKDVFLSPSQTIP